MLKIQLAPEKKIILTTISLAIFARLLYWLETGAQAFRDSEGYNLFGINILNHGTFGIGDQPIAGISPGLSLCLALFYKICGVNVLAWFSCLQAISVSTCCFIADSARRLFGARSGLIAGIISAIYPQFLNLSITGDGRSLSVLGLVAAGWFFIREYETFKKRYLLFAGLALGVSYLGRVQLLLFPVFIPIWAIARFRFDLKKALLSSCLVLMGMSIGMAGWVVRNYMAFGIFMPGGTLAGYAFAAVNNELNFNSGRGRGENMTDTAPAVFSKDSEWVNPDGTLSEKFLKLPEYVQDRKFTTATWNWIFSNPKKFLIHGGFKMKHLWVTARTGHWPGSAWLGPINVLIYGFLTIPFAIYGAIYMWFATPEKIAGFCFWLVVAFYTTMLHFIFEGHLKHRCSFEPGLIMLAAYGITIGLQKASNKKDT